MEIAADALITLAGRHAEQAWELASVEGNPQRKAELEKIVEVCSRVPAEPPRDFWEALQMYWFCHLGVVIELNTWDSFNPGRLDQHLIGFYEESLEDGSLTREFARELLECFWIKFNNQPAPPKVMITEEQSGTYQDFALINVGGLKADGSDAVNELSYLILDVVEEMRLIQPSACIQLSKKNPDSARAIGDPEKFSSFDELLEAYREQLRYFLDIKIQGNNVIERLFAEHMPAPFMSLLFDDCIKKARDYHDGGPRYNATYIQGVGMGTVTDSLSAFKFHVFDEKNIEMTELLALISNNFEGSEIQRQMLLNRTPKYGNDDDYADTIAISIFDAYFDAIDGRPNTKGGRYRVNLLPTTVHIYFGRVTGATPDGRKDGEPLSDGISPSHGADKNGPTAVLKSVAKIDHVKTGGTLLNLKFTPQVLADEEDIEKLLYLIRAYFKLEGHHVQFNVVDSKVLRDAQENPEKYRDLIIRVAGYSDYFVDIGRELQDEIIARTEHKAF